MTYKEAIKYAKIAQFCCGCNIDELGWDLEAIRDACHKCEHRQFFETAIRAFEKQIPRKPEEYCDGYYAGYPVIEYKCPCCGKDVDDTDHHCVCGQKLDWSEENG